MGVTWMSELIYFLVGWIFGKQVVWKYFIVNDFINFSQGTGELFPYLNVISDPVRKLPVNFPPRRPGFRERRT